MPNWVANHIKIQGKNSAEVLRSLLTEREDENEAGCGFDLDFNKIIPMPESLKIESGSTTNACVEMYLTSINPFVNYYGENKLSADEYLKICRNVQDSKSYGQFNDKLPLEEIIKRENGTEIWIDSGGFRQLSKQEIINYGKTAVDNIITYGAMDWYDWSIKNWGTKWNACRTQIPDTETAEVYFDTAWSPVPQILLALTEKYPDCIFEYEYAEEQPGNFAGYCVCQAGEILTDESFDTDSKECYETFFRLWGCEDEYKFNAQKGTYEYIENEEEM